MDKIIPSFRESLFDGAADSIIELGELGIDSILDDGLFKELPIVNFLIGVKNTAQNIHDRNLLKQTLQFIKEFNSGTINKEKLQEYKEKIENDSKKAEKELGRVVIILNSTIEVEKSKMIANLFRNYINQNINWEEFCEFSEIVRMLFLNDIIYLRRIYTGQMKDTTNCVLYPIDRLTSLGLINTTMKSIVMSSSSNSRTDKYLNLTAIGGKFYQSIIN